MSCASAGNCGAVGYYAGDGAQAFTVSEANRTWGIAIDASGTAA